jgi:hypothetical protein
MRSFGVGGRHVFEARQAGDVSRMQTEEKMTAETAQRMPGTKAKQAAALSFNIKWMADTFGVERVGFLTLTVGDTVDGKFVHVKERAEASRRFNSILNRIRERYQCGVVVTERHKNGGIHFHMVVVMPFDVKTGFDFDAVKRRDYRSVSKRLRDEWLWWRENQAKYGFGRHELTPIKSNGEAIGRYVGKYLGKSWEAKTDDDYRGRCVRYFGRWSKEGVKCGPPMSSRHGTLTKRACAWRECAKQVQIWSKHLGAEINEHNIAEKNGPRWAWRITKQFNRVEFLVPARSREIVRQGISEHNEEPTPEEGGQGCGRKPVAIWETTLDVWWQQPDWESELNLQDIASRKYCMAGRKSEAKRRACQHSFDAAQVWFEGLAVEEQNRLCKLN